MIIEGNLLLILYIYTEVIILHKNISFGYSLEVPHQGASNTNMCFYGHGASNKYLLLTLWRNKQS